MPLQRYDKDKILRDCLTVFAQHGYEKTTTGMLAEAAGVSRPLLFHHFTGKKELYLRLLDQCIDQARNELNISGVLDAEDFFVAREQFSLMKLNFHKNNPNIYKVLKEAYLATPPELQAEMKQRTAELLTARNAIWKTLFEKVPLRPGVDRNQAFSLVTLALDHFDQKYLAEMTDETELDEAHVRRFLQGRNEFLEMIRFGIESRHSEDRSEEHRKDHSEEREVA